METDVFVRHSADCPHRNNRYYKKCRCRKWIALVGLNKRISAQTRSWEQAERKARQLAGDPVTSGVGQQTIVEAARLFVEDKQEQGASKHWIYKHRRELKDLVVFANANAVSLVTELNLQMLEDFRKRWPGVGITRRKRQERLRQFFRYCMKHKWCSENVAADLSNIKVDSTPTLPLTREQFAAVLAAADEYNPLARDRELMRKRAKAMLMFLRHSGLRISDAALSERTRLLPSNNLFLYTGKTGQHVYVPLPPHVARLLRGLPNKNPKYFFWNGTSSPESPGKRWWSTLKRIFRRAYVPDGHPHCLRDTFAVECLLKGVDIKDVSMMLGHASIAITEKHYLPWVRARQVHLEDTMKKVWAADAELETSQI